MTEYEFLLKDRIQKIQSLNEQYDFEKNAYISYSGGKDSTVLSELVDMAIPNNRIPRLFLNTGLEYKKLLQFVREKAEADSRIIILTNTKNIREVLESKGYPFKSKQHARIVDVYQRNGFTKTSLNYIGRGTKESFLCPKKLEYQFSEDFKLKLSDKCCFEFKKIPAHKWGEENGRHITLTGIRQEEGGQRTSIKGCVTHPKKNEIKIHPLLVLSESWIDEFIKQNNIKLCELYYPPYNFNRTGCIGCPFQREIRKTLETLERLLPTERKRAELIFHPVYEEYRRINYRLRGTKDE